MTRSLFCRLLIRERRGRSFEFLVFSFGSSGKPWGLLMNEEEAEFEVFGISESVGLPFEDFDFVVEAFKGSGSDSVFEVVQDLGFVAVKDLCEFLEVVEAAGLSSADPSVEESMGFSLWKAPEVAQLLFEQVGLEEGFVEALECGEMLGSVCTEVFIGSEQQEPCALDDLLFSAFEFAVEAPPGVVDGPICHGNHVKGIVDDVDVGQCVGNGSDECRPHVDRDGSDWRPEAFEGAEKGHDRIATFAITHVEHMATLEVHHQSHIAVALSDGKLVDREVSDVSETTSFVFLPEVFFEDLFYQVPPHTEPLRYMFDRRDSAQINDKTFKGPDVTLLSISKEDRLPQGPTTTAALLVMPVQDNPLAAPPYRKSIELPPKPSIQTKMLPARTTNTAPPFPRGELNVEEDASILVFRTDQPVPAKTQSVVNKARRRHRGTSFWFRHQEGASSGGDFSIENRRRRACGACGKVGRQDVGASFPQIRRPHPFIYRKNLSF